MADQPASPVALRAVSYCRKAIGTPYVWGGTTSHGYDCSGLVYAAYRTAGLATIPRTSEEQYAAGYQSVPWGQWAEGDLIFSQWPGDGASPGHVVIYAGGGITIAAPHTGTTVQYEPVTTFAPPHYVGSSRPSVPTGLSGGSTPPPGGSPVTAAPSSSSSSDAGGAAGAVAGLGAGSILLVAVAGVAILGVVFLLLRSKGQSSSSSPPAPEAGGAG